jgi:hypothetical protein
MTIFTAAEPHSLLQHTSEAAASDALQDFPDGSSGPRSSSCSSSVVDDCGISMGFATVVSTSSFCFSLCNDVSDPLYRAGADARVVDELDDFNFRVCSILEVADSLVFNDADCWACLLSAAFLVNCRLINRMKQVRYDSWFACFFF